VTVQPVPVGLPLIDVTSYHIAAHKYVDSQFATAIDTYRLP
jgi:hypothetical protein